MCDLKEDIAAILADQNKKKMKRDNPASKCMIPVHTHTRDKERRSKFTVASAMMILPILQG